MKNTFNFYGEEPTSISKRVSSLVRAGYTCGYIYALNSCQNLPAQGTADGGVIYFFSYPSFTQVVEIEFCRKGVSVRGHINYIQESLQWV